MAVAVGAHHVALLAEIESLLEVDGGESLILASGNRGSLLEAVYMNALSANLMDFDDAHVDTGHPGASIVQPALVLAERHGNSREEVLEAVVAGYELGIRWGRAFFSYPDKFEGPWSSAMLQSFATVVTASKLLNLTEEEIEPRPLLHGCQHAHPRLPEGGRRAGADHDGAAQQLRPLGPRRRVGGTDREGRGPGRAHGARR